MPLFKLPSIRDIGRVVGTVVGGPIGGTVGGAIGGGIGSIIGGGGGRPRTPAPSQPPMPPVLAPTGPVTPIGTFVPGFPAPPGPPVLPPPGPPAPPPVTPTRPYGPGPGTGAVQTAAVGLVGRFVSPAMIKRLAGLFKDFLTGLGSVITLDAALEVMNSPVDLLDAQTLDYLRQFRSSPQYQAFAQFGEDGMGPLILPAIKEEQYNPPAGYVTVEIPGTGETVYMQKWMAIKRGLWKPGPKPPISVREWKAAKAFGRVQKKLKKMSKPFEPRVKTVYAQSKGKRC